jgi:hypothetical protein
MWQAANAVLSGLMVLCPAAIVLVAMVVIGTLLLLGTMATGYTA